VDQQGAVLHLVAALLTVHGHRYFQLVPPLIVSFFRNAYRRLTNDYRFDPT